MIVTITHVSCKLIITHTLFFRPCLKLLPPFLFIRLIYHLTKKRNKDKSRYLAKMYYVAWKIVKISQIQSICKKWVVFLLKGVHIYEEDTEKCSGEW